MTKFEVGKRYYAYGDIDPILITRRTEKTVWVDNGGCKWRMRVRQHPDGYEYVADSLVSKAWRDEFTYSARLEVNG